MGSSGHLPAREGRPSQQPPRPLGSVGSLVAASRAIVGKQIKTARPQRWQDEAWALYDEVGELRFVANALASASSRARFFAARAPMADADPDPIDPAESEDPLPPDDLLAAELVASIGGSVMGRAELIRRLVLQMFVPGDGYLIGLPPGVLDLPAPADRPPTPEDIIPPEGAGDVTVDRLVWQAFSVNEVTARRGEIVLNVGDGSPVTLPDTGAVVCRVWRAHPRRFWEADSPVRANLPVLRELVGLTKHVGATIDSRLAGAGLLIIGQSVDVIGASHEGTDAEQPPADFVEALIEAMVTPIENREDASAVVPLAVRVPDDAVDLVKHISFAQPFDAHAKELRDEAIRRLALGLDAPPEVLLGLGSTNHWSAWQIDEATTKTHIEPLLALIADALTVQFLWPALTEAGVQDPSRYVVWFDTANLTLRPNRTAEATEGVDRGLLSGSAWRRETGFGEEDAPEVSIAPAAQMVLDIARSAPNLVGANPAIIIVLLDLIEALMDGRRPELPEGFAPTNGGPAPAGSGRDLPDTRDEVPDAIAAAISRTTRGNGRG
jgi:hypothetical protein